VCEVLDVHFRKRVLSGRAERAGRAAGFVAAPAPHVTLRFQRADHGWPGFTAGWTKKDSSARKADVSNPNLLLENISHLYDEPGI